MKTVPKGYLTFLYFLFSIFLIFLESQNAIGLIHKIPQNTTVPVRSWLYGIRVNSLSPLASFTTINEEIKELRNLQTKNSDLESQIASLQSLKEENIQMRRLLDTGLPPVWQFSPARVVNISSDNAYLLGDENVKPSVPVIVSTDLQNKKSGVLIGRVAEIVGRETKINLVTSQDSKIPVIVRDLSTLDRRASGILVGRGGKAVLDQVLVTEDLHEGDLIITSGDSGLPPDLLIGSVGQVLSTNNSTLKQADVKLAVKPESLSYVFLITKF